MKVKATEILDWLDTLDPDATIDSVTYTFDDNGKLLQLQIDGLDDYQMLWWKDELEAEEHK